MFFSTRLHFVRKCSILARTEVAMFFWHFLTSFYRHLCISTPQWRDTDISISSRNKGVHLHLMIERAWKHPQRVSLCICVFVCVCGKECMFLLMCKGFGDVMHLIRYLKIHFSAFPNSFTLYVCLSLSLHWFLPPSALSRSTPAFLLIADPLVQSQSVTL